MLNLRHLTYPSPRRIPLNIMLINEIYLLIRGVLPYLLVSSMHDQEAASNSLTIFMKII